MKKILFACAFSVMATPVVADGFYVAADVGSVNWDVGDLSTSKTAWGLAAGYEFSLKFKDTMAVELGYRHLGTLTDGDDSYQYRTEITTPQISFTSTHHFTPQIAAYARLGLARLEMDWRVSDSSNQVDNISTAKNRAVFGIGGRYQFDEHLAAHIEYTYLKWEDITLSGPALGLKYSF